MPRLAVSIRKRVILWWKRGYSIRYIKERLEEEDTCITTRSLQRLVKKFRDHYTIRDLPRKKRPKKLTEEMVTLLDDMLRENDETTATQIRSKLMEQFEDLNVSLSTVKRARKEEGWVCTRPHYCQLIRDVNKLKRKEWCQRQIDMKEKFENVIFTDECTVQLDHHGRLCFRKAREPRAHKQRPKHPANTHLGRYLHKRCNTNCNVYWHYECCKICENP